MTLVGANTLHSSHAKLVFYLSLSYEFLRCMCKTFKCRQIEFWEKIKARKRLTLKRRDQTNEKKQKSIKCKVNIDLDNDDRVH